MEPIDEVERIMEGQARSLFATNSRLSEREMNLEEELSPSAYEIRPDPQSEQVDLSKIRGQSSVADMKCVIEDDPETELAALAELLPEVTKRRHQSNDDSGEAFTSQELKGEKMDWDQEYAEPGAPVATPKLAAIHSNNEDDSESGKKVSGESVGLILNRHSQSRGMEPAVVPVVAAGRPGEAGHAYDDAGAGAESAGSFDDYPDSDNPLDESGVAQEEDANISKEFLNSGQSISTATQTHEVRMPMSLPTFKPATGCTNASDFIVRCFVARLRSGITVVKHGRSRWCKSRLRVLQIHPDGRSLTWKPAEGEPITNRKPPKLDLSTCLEVRHAWSPDPNNPMYTGTAILRQKCEAANAHKSFALIFKHRTVDITAVTADQCKVLMEGFSALCFRLQVASLAGRSGPKNKNARPMPDDDGVSVTASATLTNSSTPKNR